MGDVRYDNLFERVKQSHDRAHEIETLSDEDVIAALGGASRGNDPLLANVLATEAQNRAHRATAITASLGEGVIAMDARWRVSLVNPAAERLLGWDSSDVTGRDLHKLIHPFCNAPDECHLATLPPADFFYQNDDALVMRKDGRTIRVAYTVTPMVRFDEVEGGIIVFRDSSERKRQEEKAGTRQDRLQKILDSLAEGVLVMDMGGRITYANVAAERILGRAARDIAERTYYDPAWNFVTTSGDILPVTDLPFKKALDSGLPTVDAELGILRGDGSVILLNVNTVPLRDAAGVAFAVLISFLDITERKHLEAELRAYVVGRALAEKPSNEEE